MKKNLIFYIFIIFILNIIIPAQAKKVVIPKMPETKEDWLKKSECVPIEERKSEIKNINEDKNTTKTLAPHAYIAKYNIPYGSWEANIASIKKDMTLYSTKVVSPDFEKFAITYYYFIGNSNQVASELFIVPLETNKTRVQRIIDASTFDLKKGQNLTSGTDVIKDNYFSSLTIVDWSSDGNGILLKEKIGTTNSGIFKTVLITGNYENGKWKYTRYPNLNEKIIKYNEQKNKIALNNYRWDIKILGYSRDNKNVAVVKAVTWDKNGKENFLNLWGLNTKTGEILLVSTQKDLIPISANGYKLEFTYE